MSLIKNISKYSHCVYGRYEIRPPTESEKRVRNIAGIDADQFYESSASGGAVPFKFLIELRMAQHGNILFDAYYASLQLVAQTIVREAERYAKEKGITLSAADLDKVTEVKHNLAIRIRVFIPRIYTDKVDTEILWFVRGDEKGITEFDKVCDAVGFLTVLLLARELMRPIKIATDAIQSNMGG